MHRRSFLAHSMAAAAFSASYVTPNVAQAASEVQRLKGVRLKLCLNAYSFNAQLMSGQMTMDEIIDFCAEHEIDGVDMTGYYFSSYPEPPSDEVIYKLKRKAFVNGVTISGTGVRNDFALTDASSRKGQIALVKDWVEVAAKLGADVVRVFSGRQVAQGATYEKTLDWMVPAFEECAAYGSEHGVIVGLQHHDDFLKTADQTIQVVEAVNSPWFGVILDVGSVRQHDVYEEIEKLVPYAVTWQVKEEVWQGEKAMPIDLQRLKSVIDETGYRGFLPFEALGSDSTVQDRKKRVARFLDQIKDVFFS